MADRLGQRLGNYHLLRLLGQGGFAQVYLGEHLRLGTQAAIKLLFTHLPDDDVEQFLAEARSLARLEHPHIIRILDFDVEQDIPFLVMSFAPNGTLRQRYPRGTRLPLDTILTYLKQAAGALQCAHDARLVHRDIKPENMLLDRRDDILLSDFGIAVVAHSSRSQSTQEIIGTVSYMSPEQIQGKPRPASDQYSLGVVAYEWLCGCPPFHGTAAEITTQHLHADPPPLREQVPGIPPTIEAVVLKALEKDPHRRFASVQEFAMSFEQASQAFLPATPAMLLNHAAWSASAAHALEEAPFYASRTLAESTLQPPRSDKRGISRRALLVGAIGVVGLAGTSGGFGLWALSQQRRMGSTLVTYTGHLSAVATVAWSPDGKRIASGSWDQTVQVWDPNNGAHLFVYRGHTTNVNAVAWSPARTGQRIASASGNSFFKGEHVVQVWDAATNAHPLTYQGHTQPVHTVAWSPGGTHIASGGEDKTVQVWDAGDGNPIFSYSRHTGLVSSVAWSPDGTRIASASNDTTVQVWNARTAALIFSFSHTSTVNAVAWSPDGTRIASASGNLFLGGEHSVQVWDAITGVHILTYKGHTTQVSTVAWSPDGKHIASASAGPEKNVQIWDATSGTTIYTYRGHTLGVNDVAWSPDGQFIASASNDGTVRVWQAS
ncbi:MAG TPA: serine/threonine-protein kinase [Ktedonobacteraceae bacterium]